MEWDGWPDGTFERLFTHAEVEAVQGLQVNWAMRRHGGDRKGDHFSKTVEGGKSRNGHVLGSSNVTLWLKRLERRQIRVSCELSLFHNWLTSSVPHSWGDGSIQTK